MLKGDDQVRQKDRSGETEWAQRLKCQWLKGVTAGKVCDFLPGGGKILLLLLLLQHQFHCSVVPGPGCLYGNWNEDVAVGQLNSTQLNQSLLQ